MRLEDQLSVRDLDATDTVAGRAPAGEVPAAPIPLRRVLEQAIASRSEAVNRLSYAETSVAFRPADGGEAVVLLLDRRPPRVADADEPAEIEIELSAEQANAFALGALPTPAGLVSGSLRARGPVRKYLEVDPILRRLLRRAHARVNGTEPVPTVEPGRHGASLDPDLLAIETRDVHKAFGAQRVLDGVNLQIPEGVVSVVLGPSGTGKSVLLQHVIGLMRPDRGDVLIRGRKLGGMSRSEVLALRTELGVMFQDGALFSTMNLFDNVAFPLRQHTDLREPAIREVVMDHLTSVGLADASERMPNELSGGMRKRAGLARAMVMDPGIILCDEPDSGLDPVRTALLADLLTDLHADNGGTMLIITHNISLARRIGQHIGILWQGRMLEAGMSRQVLESDSEFVRQFLTGNAEGPLGMD